MFEALLDRIADFHEDLIRNISGIRESQHLFDDLSDNLDVQAVAIAAEMLGAPGATGSPLITRSFDYGTVITYPFSNFNGQQTRFSDALSYGVWYGSLELDTTIYETVHRYHRFIMDGPWSQGKEIRADRRVFRVNCNGVLVNLRGKEAIEPKLIDRDSYDLTQALGRYLVNQRANGLLVRSARCTGINGAIFNPAVLSNPRDEAFLTYRVFPNEDLVIVERVPEEVLLEIRPSSLD